MAAPVGAIALAVTELLKIYIISRNAYTKAAQASGMTEEEKDELYAEEEAKMIANDPALLPKPWEDEPGPVGPAKLGGFGGPGETGSGGTTPGL